MLKLRNARRAIAMVFAALALAGSAIIATSGTANASWRDGEMFNYHKQQCLDGGGGWLSTWSCNGSSVQIWRDISSTVYYQLQDSAGQCIDSGQTSGLGSCNGGNYQLWSVSNIGTVNGRVYDQFRNVHYPNLCLDGGSNLGMPDAGPCNQGDWQWFSWN